MQPVDHDPPTPSHSSGLAEEYMADLEVQKAARFRLALKFAAAAVVVPFLPVAFMWSKVAAAVFFIGIMACAVMLLAAGAVIRGIVAIHVLLFVSAWLLGGGVFALRQLHERGVRMPWPVFPEQMTTPPAHPRPEMLNQPSA